MKVTISTDHTLTTRHATQFLGAITLIDDALTLREDSAKALVSRLNGISPSRALGDKLQELGHLMLDPYWELDFTDLVDPTLRDLVVQFSVSGKNSDDDMELVALQNGSIRGQFRKKNKRYRRNIDIAFFSLRSLLPWANIDNFHAAIAKLFGSFTVSSDARATAAGMTLVAGEVTRSVFADIKAGDMYIEMGDDDEDEGLVAGSSTTV